MLRLEATAQARTVLRQLRVDNGTVYEALASRIRLITSDPGAPLSRGLVRRMEPSGILARVCVVPVRETDQTWVIVWTLGGQDAVIELRAVEEYKL